MHDAKLGFRSENQSGRQTAHRRVGAVESHEDPGIRATSGLVDQKHRALAKADYPLRRGANDGLYIGALARDADDDKVGLSGDRFANDGAERLTGAHDGASRCGHTHRRELGDLGREKDFGCIFLLGSEDRRQSGGNDVEEG